MTGSFVAILILLSSFFFLPSCPSFLCGSFLIRQNLFDINELIELAKAMREAQKRGENLGLTE
ncbi:DUF3387 domain-containing protein, partial [Dolichospermum sp. ST_sed6]|nr:DUF3387 domain-containing protein [Dolichospermum sp. ST_sed9]MDD1434055.1 DUF3387 domain-containing protein [Dolichospermum sp. ST_sed6]MDD1474236.1 DUF3387 domain-containing protein [Dolichospermum sp. ST_sed4]